MTCKDCLYYEVCPLGLAVKGKTGICLKFKNKTDFVEVVRCKNCKRYYFWDVARCMVCELDDRHREETDFCSYGQRSDNE